ncbi:MAG: enoyl-CoA hydratase/isomerase family protein [Solirubrobacterales bacterium]
MPDIEYSVAKHVATIVLNRPQRKNAFTLEMIDDWARCLREAQADPEVRAVVVYGAGGAFCAGVDLDVFAGREHNPLSEKRLLSDRVHAVALAADALSKPYLAAITGVAIGAGFDMALMADIRLAARTARMAEGYVNVGLVPGDGGCYYLPRIIGTANALRLLWTGDKVSAEQALELGLVSEVFEDDELVDGALALAGRIAAQPPVAVELIKRAVHLGEGQDLRSALELIAGYQAVVTSTEDSREALSAFREQRPGAFSGR